MILRDDCKTVVWFNPREEVGTTLLLTALSHPQWWTGEENQKKIKPVA